MKRARSSLMILSALFLSANSPSTAFSQGLCSDGTMYSIHLDWALNHDDVVNEGAECGLSILGTIAGFPVPPIQLGIGNIFKRPEMMRGAIAIYKMGYVEQGINVAICSQYHNAAATQCLHQHRNLVGAWLATH